MDSRYVLKLSFKKEKKKEGCDNMSIVKPLLVGKKTLFGVFVSFSSAIACWNSSNAKI